MMRSMEKNYAIPISSGILKDGHPEKMGRAVWLYMWFINKMTKIDENGLGLVLGGKPIQIKDIDHLSRRTTQRYISILKNAGYIQVIYTMRGIIIKVTKAKKYFGHNMGAKSGAPRASNMAHHDTKYGAPDTTKVAHHSLFRDKSGAPNKTIQDDNTGIHPAQGAGAPDTDQKKEESKTIAEMIELFKPINPAVEFLYGRQNQREAIRWLLDKCGGRDKLSRMIQALPGIIQKRGAPQITTPMQLQEKLGKLIIFYKQNNQATSPIY